MKKSCELANILEILAESQKRSRRQSLWIPTKGRKMSQAGGPMILKGTEKGWAK
ncbi:MAG: hypothetical protein HFH89_01325 [Lachnospiraceae bacterium]|nr:hypothetical protein [Lachnospiraceae bacterium]